MHHDFMAVFKRLKNPSSWRRLSIANWRAANDPTIYANLAIDFNKGLQFLEKINQQSPEKITPTHVVAKALALTLAKFPDLNGMIAWRKIYLRQSVDVFLQVAIPPENTQERPDLSGAKIDQCDQKPLAQIAAELRQKSENIRNHNDPQFKKTIGSLRFIPDFLLPFIFKIMTFLIYNLRISAPKLGLPDDPFGSAMVTSVGMLKMPAAFAPLVPISRCPLIICVGEITDKPWVVAGQVVARPILELGFTVDHRFIDGFGASHMAHYFRSILEDPEKHLN